MHKHIHIHKRKKIDTNSSLLYLTYRPTAIQMLRIIHWDDGEYDDDDDGDDNDNEDEDDCDCIVNGHDDW